MIQEPKQTCPDIDHAKGHLDDAIGYVRSARKECEWAQGDFNNDRPDRAVGRIDDVDTYLVDIGNELESIQEHLEELRTTNAALRAYGDGWKKRYEGMEKQNSIVYDNLVRISRAANSFPASCVHGYSDHKFCSEKAQCERCLPKLMDDDGPVFPG